MGRLRHGGRSIRQECWEATDDSVRKRVRQLWRSSEMWTAPHNSAEQGSREVGCVAGSWGRNASRRLGGDGPRRRWSGLRATRGPRQRRVCSRGLGLRALRGRHLGWRRRGS